MKTVYIDTNMSNSDGSYHVDGITIKGRNIKTGDKVIAYQDGEEWDARVIFNNGLWGIELISAARTVSDEKRLGYKEGFWEGYYCQLINFSRIINQIKLSKDDLEFVLAKMNISL